MKLFESKTGDLLVVDVQPEYEEYISFSLISFSEYVQNNNFSSVNFLYNGNFTIGMVEEREYKRWLIEKGFEPHFLEIEVNFFDKGYAFFRSCMNHSENVREDLVKFVRFMWKNKIRDSRDIPNELWSKIDQKEIKDILKDSSEVLFIPDLMDYLVRNVGSNIELVGGGRRECLKEVEIALRALNKSYNLNEEWIY